MGAKSKPGLNKCNAWWHSNSTFCNMDTMYIAINCELYSNRQKNVKWPMLVTDSRFKWKSGKILQIPKQVILDSPVTWLAFRVAIEGTAQFFFIDKEEYFVFAPRRVCRGCFTTTACIVVLVLQVRPKWSWNLKMIVSTSRN